MIPYGTFKATKDGLVEIPQKWIRAEIDGETIFITPKNPLYSVVSAYGKSEEVTLDEVQDYLADKNDEERTLIGDC